MQHIIIVDIERGNRARKQKKDVKMKKCTEDMNERLNGYVKNDYPLADDKEWTIWATKANGAAWYTVVEDGEPSDDNIIEGETGDLMYLDLEDAKTQWGMYKTYSRIEDIIEAIERDEERPL
jgi:hypothetical protein